jgi:hypothetical protein
MLELEERPMPLQVSLQLIHPWTPATEEATLPRTSATPAIQEPFKEERLLLLQVILLELEDQPLLRDVDDQT